MEEKFMKMLMDYPDCIRDKKTFLSYMKDIMPTEKLFTNVLGNLIELGIVEDIINSQELDAAFEYRYLQNLKEIYGVSEDNANRAIFIWAEYYGHQILGKTCSVTNNESTAKRQEEIRGKLYQDLFSYRTGIKGIVTGCNDKDASTIVVPTMIQNNSMSCISSSAFEGFLKVEQVVISDGIKEIGSKAFFNCRNLKQVILPSSIERIGSEAFAECNKLVTANIPDSVRTIDDFAFENTNIKKIRFPKTVFSVGRGLYKNCKNLSSVELPERTLDIPAQMFMNCTGLTKFILPSGLRRIESRAFSGCNNIAWIQFPSSVCEIADDAFEGMSKDFIMICEMNSVAEKYAREHNIRYQLG